MTVQKSIVTATPPNIIGQFSPEFDDNSFNSAVWNKGYSVLWERACECPCRGHDNKNLLTCQNCFGKGWFFINPVETRTLMSSINRDTKMKSWSQELVGTVSVTMRASEGTGLARIGYMDRITMKNDNISINKSIFSEVLRVREYNGQKFVFLSYKPLNIIDVWGYTSETTQLYKLGSTQYSISGDNPYVLNLDIDFWDTFNGAVSIQYEHEVQYHVIDLPHDIRNSWIVNSNGKEEQILLPINAIARRAQNVFDVDNSTGDKVLDNSYLGEKQLDLLSSSTDVLSSSGQVKSGDTKY